MDAALRRTEVERIVSMKCMHVAVVRRRRGARTWMPRCEKPRSLPKRGTCCAGWPAARSVSGIASSAPRPPCSFTSAFTFWKSETSTPCRRASSCTRTRHDVSVCVRDVGGWLEGEQR